MWLQQTTVSSTFTWNGSGGTSAAITIYVRRLGDWIVVTLPAVSATTGTSSTQLAANTALPAWARPLSKTQYGSHNAINNNATGVAAAGLCILNTSGILTILRDNAATAFTNSSSCGASNMMTLTYYVGTGS